MGEVKRDRDAGHAVWRKPLLGQPNMRFEANSPGIELAVEALNVGFEKRTLDFNGQVADAQVKQLFVAEPMPGESVAHGGQDSSREAFFTQRRKVYAESPSGIASLRLCVNFAPLRETRLAILTLFDF